MSEDQPQRVRIWTLERARETVSLQIQILPELLAELMRLSGRRPGLINPILDKVADGVSFEPYSAVTPDTFRRHAGAPEDPAQMETWRKTLYDEYQTRHNPQHIVRP